MPWEDDSNGERRVIPDRRLSRLLPNADTPPHSSRAKWRVLIIVAVILASASLLTSALLFSTAVSRGQTGRLVLRQSTIVVCQAQNRTNKVLREILRESEGQLHQYEADGTITPRQMRRGIGQAEHAIRLLANVPCDMPTH